MVTSTTATTSVAAASTISAPDDDVVVHVASDSDWVGAGMVQRKRQHHGGSPSQQEPAALDDGSSCNSRIISRTSNSSRSNNNNNNNNNNDVYNYDARTWEKVPDQTYKRSRNKSIRRYYKQQNQLIDRLQSFYTRVAITEEEEEEEGQDPAGGDNNTYDDDGVTTTATTDINGQNNNKNEVSVSLAINGSFLLNIFLLVIKVLAAVLSGSMSVIASAADSALDLLSGTVLVVTQRLMRKSDPVRYPQGKSRIEPIGVFSFAIVMMLSSLQIVLEAVKRLVSHPTDIELGPYTLAILSFTIISKFLANRYCRYVSQTYKSSAVDAYADDHRNDVMTNMVGVLAAVLSVFVPQLWWFDATGAICIAFYIIYCWLQTMREQLGFLAGRGAPPMLLQELTYIAANHDARIEYVDTVRAYHFGETYLVEVDIVLPENMPLRESHDIGESLQHRLEQVENVERAFVHNDFEWEHSPVSYRGNYILRK